MATLLATIDSTGMQVRVTLVAGHLVAVLLLGELAEGRLDDAAPPMKHQVQVDSFWIL